MRDNEAWSRSRQPGTEMKQETQDFLDFINLELNKGVSLLRNGRSTSTDCPTSITAISHSVYSLTGIGIYLIIKVEHGLSIPRPPQKIQYSQSRFN